MSNYFARHGSVAIVVVVVVDVIVVDVYVDVAQNFGCRQSRDRPYPRCSFEWIGSLLLVVAVLLLVLLLLLLLLLY